MTVDLEGLLGEVHAQRLKAVVGPASVVSPPPSGGGAIQKLRYTHEAMIDQMIANPAISQNQLAAVFGYSASWISQVIASDAFQSKLAERTKELVDPTIRASVEEQFRGILYRSMEILKEKLACKPDLVPDQLALRAAELSSKALGYGVQKPELPKAPVEMHLHLEQLGDNLTKLLDRKRREAVAVDTTFSEIAPEEDQSVKTKA